MRLATRQAVRSSPNASRQPAAQHRSAGVVAPRLGGPLDAEGVVIELESAGATLLALRTRRASPAETWSRSPDVVHQAIEAYGYTAETMRPPIPDPRSIDRMDEVLAWISLIPSQQFVLRRIVGARALVSPLTGAHLFTWRRIGRLIGADHRAVKRWHAQGVQIITAALRAKAVAKAPKLWP